MITLGIHDGHGASVALFQDDRLVAAIEEERPTRKKGCSGFPASAIDRLRDEFPKLMSNIDAVAVGTIVHDFSLFATKRYPEYSIADFLFEEKNYWKPVLCDGEQLDYLAIMSHKVKLDDDHYPLHTIVDNPSSARVQEMRRAFISDYLNISAEKIEFIDHHTCHANHAFFASPIREDCLVLTMDGAGDGANCTLSEVRGGEITELYRTNECNIGKVYQYVTQLLGMKPAEHEYKVMGLAAYAKEHYIQEPLEVFKQTYGLQDGKFVALTDIENHYQYFKDRLEGYRFDAIAGQCKSGLKT